MIDGNLHVPPKTLHEMLKDLLVGHKMGHFEFISRLSSKEFRNMIVCEDRRSYNEALKCRSFKEKFQFKYK